MVGLSECMPVEEAAKKVDWRWLGISPSGRYWSSPPVAPAADAFGPHALMQMVSGAKSPLPVLQYVRRRTASYYYDPNHPGLNASWDRRTVCPLDTPFRFSGPGPLPPAKRDYQDPGNWVDPHPIVFADFSVPDIAGRAPKKIRLVKGGTGVAAPSRGGSSKVPASKPTKKSSKLKKVQSVGVDVVPRVTQEASGGEEEEEGESEVQPLIRRKVESAPGGLTPVAGEEILEELAQHTPLSLPLSPAFSRMRSCSDDTELIDAGDVVSSVLVQSPPTQLVPDQQVIPESPDPIGEQVEEAGVDQVQMADESDVGKMQSDIFTDLQDFHQPDLLSPSIDVNGIPDKGKRASVYVVDEGPVPKRLRRESTSDQVAQQEVAFLHQEHPFLDSQARPQPHFNELLSTLGGLPSLFSRAYQEELQGYKQAKNLAEERVQSLKQQLLQLSSSHQDLQSRCKFLEGELSEKQQAIVRKDLYMRRQKELLDEGASQLGDLKGRLDNLKGDLAQMEQELKVKDERIDNLSSSLKQAQISLSASQSEVAAVKLEKASLQSSFEQEKAAASAEMKEKASAFYKAQAEEKVRSVRDKTKEGALWYTMNAVLLAYPGLDWSKIEPHLGSKARSPPLPAMMIARDKSKAKAQAAGGSSAPPPPVDPSSDPAADV